MTNRSPLPRILQGDPYTVPGTDRTTVALFRARVSCGDCHGRGEVQREDDHTWEPCSECGGHGYYKEEL